MSERIVRVDDIELCTQSFGKPGDPAILLIAGAESSMDWWEDDLCHRLAEGRQVIRYDTRDTGRSTAFPVGAPPYTESDLVTDALGVLDAYGVERAHVAGVSMGGSLAQHLAVEHPERVATLILISTGPGGDDLPPMSDELAKRFAEPAPGPDWSDRESVIAYFLAGEHTFAGDLPVDEERVRHIAGRAFDRSRNMATATNHWQVGFGEPVRPRLGEITAPTLVLHGTKDPLLPFGHGEALAREIPGARLVPLPGVGHQMPPREVWDVVVPAVLEHTAGGDGGGDRRG
ncbi:alpha/beta hydrolase [Nonomuraea sp. NN258]|uniref:alpha/beta fold hydrolase n=1 Tax=Nonomuraea antri TaxID=2730852 RepID=UPI0015684974|nr:alpha/beta hydrolase [Nonomuraea antri]NRQ31429.1 alpha/beta hydrolase [Nonomuraea antri]